MISDKHKYSLKSVKAMLIVVILLACLTTYMDSQMQKQEQSEEQINEIAAQIQEQAKLKEERDAKAREAKQIEEEQNQTAYHGLSSSNEQTYNEYQENMNNFEQTQQPQEFQDEQNQNQYEQTNNVVENIKQEAAIEAQNGNFQRAAELYGDVYRITNSKNDLIILGEISVSANIKNPLKAILREYLEANPQDKQELDKYVKFAFRQN